MLFYKARLRNGHIDELLKWYLVALSKQYSSIWLWLSSNWSNYQKQENPQKHGVAFEQQLGWVLLLLWHKKDLCPLWWSHSEHIVKFIGTIIMLLHVHTNIVSWMTLVFNGQTTTLKFFHNFWELVLRLSYKHSIINICNEITGSQ